MAETPTNNIFGEPVETCSTDPMTGFHRDGCCTADPRDIGNHSVCAVVTEAFLEFTAGQGNDLSTPRPEFGFPGLKPGDRWCLCASRWLEAVEAGVGPPVMTRATSAMALEVCPRDLLLRYAADLGETATEHG
jgi:hypothetical protein